MNDMTPRDLPSDGAPVNPPVRLANPRRTTLASLRATEERRLAASEHAQERRAS